MPVMTFSPESAAKVRGRTNSWAARVMMTCTRIPRSCNRRTISAALYAAIPPVTPSAIFMMIVDCRFLMLDSKAIGMSLTHDHNQSTTLLSCRD